MLKKNSPPCPTWRPAAFAALAKLKTSVTVAFPGVCSPWNLCPAARVAPALSNKGPTKTKSWPGSWRKKVPWKCWRGIFIVVCVCVCLCVCIYYIYIYIYMCVCVCLIFFHIHILLSWEQKEPKERLVMRPYSGPKSLNPLQRSQGQEPNLYWTFSPGKSMFTPLKINTTLENPPVSNRRYIFIHGGFFHWSS